MKRTTALFLALAILLAHSLAIYDTDEGEFAAPIDQAHVAFRVARNFVHHGELAWNLGEHVSEPYPSWTWLALAAVAEQLHLGPNRVCQAVGILAALATVVVLAQFSSKRLSGVVAPLLLVVGGGLASVAPDGTETALFTLLVAASFLAFERRRPVLLSLCLALACLTRPESLILLVALAVFEVARAPRAGLGRALLPCAVGAAVYAAMSAVRFFAWGHVLSAPVAGFLDPEQARWSLGLAYVRDFFLLSGGPVLVFFPLVCLPFRKLDGVGLRALLLALAWSVLVARQGGDSRPFWGAMVPLLPLLFLAIQSGMTGVMDTERPGLEPATWVCFCSALLLSVMVSKHPGDIGPLPTERFMRAWTEASPTVAKAYGRQYGRQGLRLEILAAERLRSIGIFMRDRIAPGATILTPWPGAIGYLSRRRVIDLLGRVTPLPGSDGPVSWYGRPRVDLVETFKLMPDYVLATLDAGPRPPLVREIVQEWFTSYDSVGSTPERAFALLQVLNDYELVSAPVPIRSDRPDMPTGPPAYLLRKRSLSLSPTVELEVEGRSFAVRVHHAGHQQLVDLDVRLTDVGRNVWFLRPTGEFHTGSPAHARTDILLYSTGSRPMDLLVGEIPAEIEAVELSAVLRNPGSQHAREFSAVSNSEVVALP